MASTKTQGVNDKITLPPGRTALAITVLMGGPSGEREVSLQSGQCVSEALESLGHKVYREDIAPDNLGALARQVDVVFIALHGSFGEDGGVQQILERRKINYTGSSPDACALAMNKPLAKERLANSSLPTPRWDVATRNTVGDAIACWSLPVVVKPCREGSSLNCHIIRTVEEFRPAVQSLIDSYSECLIEEYIPGLELTVSVLGDQALPPIEVRTQRPFYDYEAKYLDDTTQYLFDINLPTDLLALISEQSLKAHQVLGCRDFSRVDWRVDPTTRKAYILEVNAIPGLTSHSLLPKAAAQTGLTMPKLCDEIVRMAYRRKYD